MGSEIWGVVEGVMGYKFAYLERWLPVLTAFSDFRCPGPAPDLLSQNLDQDLGAGQLPIQLIQASRLEVGLGLGCCRLIQTLSKDFSALLPLLGGLKFFFFNQARVCSWGCIWDHFCFPWLCQLCLTGKQVGVGAQQKNAICLSKLQRKCSIGLLFFQ